MTVLFLLIPFCTFVTIVRTFLFINKTHNKKIIY
jgi:hypothetical protein